MHAFGLVLLALIAGTLPDEPEETLRRPVPARRSARPVRSARRRTRRTRATAGAAIVTPDRRLLEDTILPAFAADRSFARVLWVGCRENTVGYARAFGSRFHTLEIDPDAARFGVRGRHVTDSIVNLGRHYPARYFDLIFMNGILGFGVDDTATAEQALAACVKGLRKGGWLVLGWNDLPEHAHLHPYEREALAGMEPVELAALGTSTVEVTFRAPVRGGTWTHTYDFLRRLR